jgi:hypothetical protein
MDHSIFTERKLLVRTLLGLRTITFITEKMYYYDGGQLKIGVFLYADYKTLDKDIKAFLEDLSPNDKKKDNIQKNEMWKKITKIYYENIDQNEKD